MDIILTALSTIIGGVLIFVGGQLVAKFIIEPVYERAKLIGEIADSLIYYANLYMNPNNSPIQPFDPDKGLRDEAEKIFRRQASQLMARTHAIPCYGLVEGLRGIRARDIEQAYKELIGLANSVHQGNLEHNRARKNNIIRLLKLRIDA